MTKVQGVYAFIKERWLWKLCPTAMWNQRHERYLADNGYCNVEFSPEHYVGEESERRELSRSRSPHRRDRQPWKINEPWASGARSTGSDDADCDGDEHSFMEVRAQGRGHKRGQGSRSRGRDRGRGIQGSGNGARGSDGGVRRRVLERRPHRVEPGQAGGRRRDPRFAHRPLHECRQVPRIRFPGLVPDGTASGSRAPTRAREGFDVTDAMDEWRRLLGHTSPGDRELSIDQGGPVVSDRTYRGILQNLRDRSEQERLIMSVALVSEIRALMVELGEACHEASLRLVSVEPTEDEVEVELDEDDMAGLMQTSLGDVLRDTDENRWARLMVRLQKELAGQAKGGRKAHVAAFLARLRRALGVGLVAGFGAQLEAVLPCQMLRCRRTLRWTWIGFGTGLGPCLTLCQGLTT